MSIQKIQLNQQQYDLLLANCRKMKISHNETTAEKFAPSLYELENAANYILAGVDIIKEAISDILDLVNQKSCGDLVEMLTTVTDNTLELVSDVDILKERAKNTLMAYRQVTELRSFKLLCSDEHIIDLADTYLTGDDIMYVLHKKGKFYVKFYHETEGKRILTHCEAIAEGDKEDVDKLNEYICVLIDAEIVEDFVPEE